MDKESSMMKENANENVCQPTGNEDAKKNGEDNGMGKIKFDKTKSTFTGISKEELMKFATDPFWVRIRWILFASFWIIWAAMLLGALVIVIVSPRCSSDKEVLWYTKEPIYSLNVLQMKTANETLAVLKNIKDANSGPILLHGVLKSIQNTSDEVVDFTNVNGIFGNVEEFTNVIKSFRETGHPVFLSLDISQSSDNHVNFSRSAIDEKPFADYYIWARKKDNLTNAFGESAWEWSSSRSKFYFHQLRASQPSFNFCNDDVIEYFEGVIDFWLKAGLSGFYFPYVSERQYVDGNSCEFNSQKFQRINETAYAKGGKVISSVDVAKVVLTPGFAASNLDSAVKLYSSKNSKPIWELSCSTGKNEECFPKIASSSLIMVSLLLPGSAIIDYGSLVDTNITTVDSDMVVLLNQLMKLRTSDGFLNGNFSSYALNNNTVHAFTRMSANENNLVAWNISPEVQKLDMANFLPFSIVEITILATSSQNFLPIGGEVMGQTISLAPWSSVTLNFKTNSM